MNVVKFIAGLMCIGGIIVFITISANSSENQAVRTFSDTKTFSTMADATQYQDLIAQQSEDENALIISSVSSNSPFTVRWSVIMPKTGMVFAYGTPNKSGANMVATLSPIGSLVLVVYGINMFWGAFTDNKKVKTKPVK
jgi:hypothetical protein